MSQPRNRNLVYLADHSSSPSYYGKKVMLDDSAGTSTSQPVVEMTASHLTLGCYRITREAFEYLRKEWDEFLVNGSSKRLQ